MNDTGLIELQHLDLQSLELPHLESAPISAASATLEQNPEMGNGLGSETIAALAHDARNLITALGLYCDLLDEPGVLAPPFAHYRNELRLIAAAGRRLVSKLVAQREHGSDVQAAAQPSTSGAPWPFAGTVKASDPLSSATAPLVWQRPSYARFGDEFAATSITNLAAELLANRNLLAALAGPGIAVTVDAEGGARGIRLTAEDLTRILVNLVRNAADAMPHGGRIHISLTEISQSEIGPACQSSRGGAPSRLLLTFEDSGPGIPSEIIDKVFDRGVTTQAPTRPAENWSTYHHGLGLAITRSIIESACGRIEVSNRPGGGARFAIELPVH
jgi:signal transduction histidine kinase